MKHIGAALTLIAFAIIMAAATLIAAIVDWSERLRKETYP